MRTQVSVCVQLRESSEGSPLYLARERGVGEFGGRGVQVAGPHVREVRCRPRLQARPAPRPRPSVPEAEHHHHLPWQKKRANVNEPSV